MLGRRRWALLLGGALALGCDGTAPPPDGGTLQDGGGQQGDGGPGTDAGRDAGRDGGTPGTDSGPPTDAGGGCGSLTLPALALEEVAPGSWDSAYPVAFAQPPGSSDLYVANQRGDIVIVRDGSPLPTPFLDLGTTGLNRVGFPSRDSERGLLGLAFHPDYESNGRFFVYYTTRTPLRNVVAEYTRSAVAEVANTTETRLIDVPDRANNHNGGGLAFGPDGFLYVAMGDEGVRDDTYDNAQDLSSAFGKLHRLDVDNGPTFAAAGNPFTGAGQVPTIWAYGLRNPFRFSFDRATGDLWIGDVGQDAWEEIDFQPASSIGGENYGWPALEGTHRNTARTDVPVPASHVEPVFEYPHFGSEIVTGFVCAVTGGYVYRGTAIPGLQGWYIFADYCARSVVAFRYCDGSVMGAQRIASLSSGVNGLVSFGEDNDGELYVIDERVARIVSP